MATILLLLATGLQIALPAESSLPDEQATAPRRMREPAPPAAKDYPEILSNPMFAPDRKADASLEPPAGGMGDYTVLGIATAGAGNGTALVRMPDGSIARLQPGADLGGWKLVRFDTNALTFEKNGERHILSVEKRPPPPAPDANTQTTTDGSSNR